MNLSFRLETDIETGGTPSDRVTQPAGDVVSGASEEETLALLRRAVRLEPGEADYHFILGDALARAGRHGEAIAAFEHAVRLDGRTPTYRTALGTALLRLGCLGEALAATREALRLQPEDARSWNALGVTLFRLGRGEEAAAAFRRALKTASTAAEVHSNLGIALCELGKATEAVRAFRRAIGLRPATADYHRHLALALFALGRREEGLQCLRDSARLSPEAAEPQLDLGDALFALGQNAEAEAAYERASALAPGAVASRAQSQEARRAIFVDQLRKELEGEIRRGNVLGGFFVLGHALAGLLWALASVGKRLGRVAWLFAAMTIACAGWAFAPPYINHYLLEDAVVEAARAPVSDDREVLERLMHAVRRRGLEGHIREGDFQISTVPSWRTVSCAYGVPVRILPGLTRTLRFSIHVEQPFIEHDRPPRFL